jgi:hypothetical protein
MTTRPTSRCKIEEPVERWIGEARDLSGDLRRDELLVDGELADSGKNAWKRLQHAANVVDGVHVGGVEPGDHRIEARLLLFREGQIGLRDERIRERVVVERRVCLQVISRCVIARIAVRPRLLQRNPEEGDTADLRAHDPEELMDVGSLLDIVREVKVRVVDDVIRWDLTCRLAVEQLRHAEQERHRRRAEDRHRPAALPLGHVRAALCLTPRSVRKTPTPPILVPLWLPP